MKPFKKKMTQSAVVALIAVLVGSSSPLVSADQTAGEKGADVGRDVKRGAKKKLNRVKEGFCAEGDVKCAGKKAKHRIQEGGEAVKDKAKEAGDKID